MEGRGLELKTEAWRRRERRREYRIAPWRRVRRVVLLATVICLIPAAVSYVADVTEPHNVRFGVASVEWLRQNGGNGIVSQIENWYYTLTAPVEGRAGAAFPATGRDRGRRSRACHALPSTGHQAADPPGAARRGRLAAGRRTCGARAARPPHDLSQRPRIPAVRRGVAWIDSNRTHLAYVPGLAEPPGISHRGPAEVPTAKRDRLVATFNGGFPLETSNAGLVYRGHTIASMVKGIATLVEYRDGRVDIVRWDHGPSAGPNVWFAKQNLPPIIYEGRLNPNLSDGPGMGGNGQQRGAGLALGAGDRRPRQPDLRRGRLPDGRLAGRNPQAGRGRAGAGARHQRRLGQLHHLSTPGRRPAIPSSCPTSCGPLNAI